VLVVVGTVLGRVEVVVGTTRTGAGVRTVVDVVVGTTRTGGSLGTVVDVELVVVVRRAGAALDVVREVVVVEEVGDVDAVVGTVVGGAGRLVEVLVELEVVVVVGPAGAHTQAPASGRQASPSDPVAPHGAPALHGPGQHTPWPSHVSPCVQGLASSHGERAGSGRHADEQQSPSAVLPSSHDSPGSTPPLPQKTAWAPGVPRVASSARAATHPTSARHPRAVAAGRGRRGAGDTPESIPPGGPGAPSATGRKSRAATAT
jgi:hypothetical protein